MARGIFQTSALAELACALLLWERKASNLGVVKFRPPTVWSEYHAV
jgi:hypothetical protein